ncbi:reverse transcriptase domain-containing protein [Tanacetum coccineum]
MGREDEEKTSFHMEHGTLCHEKMAFRLKNAGATYQRLVYKALSSQIGRNIEIYVDDMALQGPELNYQLLEKLALALLHTARYLRRFFQAHAICVLTDQPIRKILLKPENYGWLAKWPIQLREHDITYKPRSPIKGQIIDDFIAETPRNNSPIEHGGAKTSRLKTQEKTPI